MRESAGILIICISGNRFFWFQADTSVLHEMPHRPASRPALGARLRAFGFAHMALRKQARFQVARK
jgi:hypothetical protein